MARIETYRGSKSKANNRHSRFTELAIEGTIGAVLMGASVGAFYEHSQVKVDETGTKLSEIRYELMQKPNPKKYEATPIINYGIIKENKDLTQIRAIYEKTDAEYEQALRELDGIRRGIEVNPSFQTYEQQISKRKLWRKLGILTGFFGASVLGASIVREIRKQKK